MIQDLLGLLIIAALGGLLVEWIGKLLHIRFLVALITMAFLLLKVWQEVDILGAHIFVALQLNWKTGLLLLLPIISLVFIVASYIRVLIHSASVPHALKKFPPVKEVISNFWRIFFIDNLLFIECTIATVSTYLASAAYSVGASMEQITASFHTICTESSLWISMAIAFFLLFSIFAPDTNLQLSKAIYKNLNGKLSLTISELEYLITHLSETTRNSEKDVEKLVRDYADFANITILEPSYEHSTQEQGK